MSSLIGPTNDCFAILASPSDHDMYHVVIYPDVPETPHDVNVSSAKLKTFLASRYDYAESFSDHEQTNVFVHSLTEADVRELTSAFPISLN